MPKTAIRRICQPWLRTSLCLFQKVNTLDILFLNVNICGCVIFHTKTHLRKNSWRGTGTRVVSLVATLLALLTHFFWILISPLSFELLSTLNSNQHFVLLTFFSTSLQNLLIFLHAEASLEPTSVSGLVGQSLDFHVYFQVYFCKVSLLVLKSKVNLSL